MAGEGSSKKAQPPLIDNLLQLGKLAFSPESPESTRRVNQSEFNTLIESTGILALMPALNLLVQPGRTEPWLRVPLISALANLPLRNFGVQHAIEFILSVHPSSAGFNTSENTGRGSAISHEALNAASRLLSSPPAGTSPDKWFSGIAPQLFVLLEGKGEPEMDRAAAFIIGFGILGRKQYGAPGMPGWKAFVEPILSCIDPAIPLSSPIGLSYDPRSDEDVISLRSKKVLISSSEITKSLQRLTALVKFHPHPALTKRLIRPILLPLWSLSSWHESNDYIKNSYVNPARDLLTTFLQLSSSNTLQSGQSNQHSSANNISAIAQNLLFRGRRDPQMLPWTYTESTDGGIQIEEGALRESVEFVSLQFDLALIDEAVSSFIHLITSIPDSEVEISHLFVQLCKAWLKDGEMRPSSVVIHPESREQTDNIGSRLVTARLMQKMMDSVPEKLISDSLQVLDLVNQVLSKFTVDGSGTGSEDIVAVALSLLNIVLTSPKSLESPNVKAILEEIKSCLYLINKPNLSLSSTSQNLILLMEFRYALIEPNVKRPSSTPGRQTEDRKSYNLAMSYLTSTDSPPPVRAQGLELLSSLIHNNSTIIDIPALIVLYSSMLQDSDEYIYLRVIKSFIELSGKHPKVVMKDLIDRYVDPNEDSELDQRLRFGEALLQVIQNASGAFSGEIALSVCEGLLSIAGRRGFRPKFEQEQKKQDLLEQKRNKEAEDIWDGPVPQLDEYLQTESDEREILSQIISGWESKRGSEDVRIRASALSILGNVIEDHVAGLRSGLISTAIDLSIHILTLEREPEKGILRRSSMLLIMSFVRALDLAREEGKALGFGLVGKSLDDVQRILEYVEVSDNDGLVRQHAKDVIEGLQTWQIKTFLPSESVHTEIQELAGLKITPGERRASADGARPRIEEIE